MTFDEYIKNPAGKGASIITNRQMYHAMYQKQFDELLVKENGLIGAFTGGLKASAGGIAAAVFFGYIASLISKPKIKKQ